MRDSLSHQLTYAPYTFSPGLDFTFDRNKQAVPDSRFSCGVLLCQENSQSSSDANLHNITSMTLFKTSPSAVSTSGNNKSGQRKTLATVSADQPELEQVSDGGKVHGHLKDGRASLRVELSKQTDCQAEFTCQVRGVDSQGKEVVSSHSLLQPHDQSDITPRDTGMAPVVIAQMLTVIQALDVKFAVLEKTTEKLEEKLEKTTESIEDKLNKLDDKLCKLDSELSAIDSKAIQVKVLNSMNDKIQEYFSEVMNVSERTDDTLERTATLLKSLNSSNKSFQENIMENLDEVFTHTNQFTQTIENSLISFKDDLNFSWQRLETSTNNSAIKAFTALHHMVSELNSSLLTNMESAFTNFFKYETCEKNASLQPAPLSYPYPLFYYRDIPEIQVPLLCDTTTDNGGWIVIQRRVDGRVDFYRDWEAYRNGFGTLKSNFWLGNEKIHAITNTGRYELRVDLKYNGQSEYARYDRFSIADESNNYKLTVGSYSGTAGDSLTHPNGSPFRTKDRDNGPNCAKTYTGAWWYTPSHCYVSNLNGKWKAGSYKGPTWYSFTYSNPADFTEMKIRLLD